MNLIEFVWLSAESTTTDCILVAVDLIFEIADVQRANRLHFAILTSERVCITLR